MITGLTYKAGFLVGPNRGHISLGINLSLSPLVSSALPNVCKWIFFFQNKIEIIFRIINGQSNHFCNRNNHLIFFFIIFLLTIYPKKPLSFKQDYNRT